MRGRGVAASGALLLLLAALAWRSLVDVDLGIHLAGGRWIAEQHAVPRLDPFSWSFSDHPYVAYHWLFQLGLHVCQQSTGIEGLVALRFALLLTTGLLLASTLRARGASPAAAAVVGLGALFAAEWRFTLRPELVSWCLAAAMLAVLEQPRRRALLWLLPILQIVWANTHVHVFGLALVGSYALEQALLARTLRTPLVGIALLCGIASLVNPYGIEGAIQPLLLSTRLSPDNVFASHIAELISPWVIAADPAQPFSTSAQLFAYRVLLVFACVAIPLLLRRRHIADAALLAIFGALSAMAVRNIAIFAVVALPALARALDLLLAALGARARRRISDALLVAACACALLQIPRIVSGTFYARERRPDRFAAELCADCLALETADWLARTAPVGPLFNNLALGSTLLWRDPQHPVFIDGRNEVSGERFYREYLRALDPAHFEAARRHFGFESVALAHRGDAAAVRLARQLLRDPDWRLVHVDAAGVVFVRSAGPNAALPAATLPRVVAPEERERLFGEIHVDAGRPAALRRWLWSREPAPGAAHGLGNLLARLDLFEAAERPLLESAARNPGFFEPHLDLGLLYQRAGMRRLALASYRNALALAPDHPDLVPLREALDARESD